MFWVNEEISYNEFNFDNTITSRWLSFCSDSTLTQSSVAVTSYLGGTNEEAYALSTSSITVNIISNSTTNMSPTLSLVQKNVLKTYAGFEATINLNGQVFYELKLSPLSDPFSLTTLKSKIKEYELTVESNKDFMTVIYNADRDHRIGIMGKNAGTFPI